MKLALSMLVACLTVQAAEKPSVFIGGSGRGAYDARKQATKAKCFILAGNTANADATLEVSETHRYGVVRGRIESSDAAALLTSREGTALWRGASMFGAGKIVKTLDRDLCKGKVAVH